MADTPHVFSRGSPDSMHQNWRISEKTPGTEIRTISVFRAQDSLKMFLIQMRWFTAGFPSKGLEFPEAALLRVRVPVPEQVRPLLSF